jgi:hypothetical protein
MNRFEGSLSREQVLALVPAQRAIAGVIAFLASEDALFNPNSVEFWNN